VRTQYAYGATLAATAPTAGDRADELLDQAEAGATGLGMARVAEQASALRAQLHWQVPGALTPREIEVLRLIAAGHSNREIATELVVSINTVLRHVTHILTKTGSANRAEAAAFAVQHGLL
jgi:DNA-binding NarL/FixJ family response regulator